MRRFALLLSLMLALPSALHAQAVPRLGVAAAPGQLCRQAIQAAERAHGIPSGLLSAMGQVESGRPDPRAGAVLPWPWTIDVEGQGAFFDTEAAAIAAVRAAQARGVRSIDVGCLQVNLMHHPQAFTSLAQAFDPASNADYAARFLRTLFAQTGSWPQAAALYHSATPALAAAYRQRVLAAWPEDTRGGQSGAGPSFASNWGSALPRPGLMPVRRVAGSRIPVGWHLAAHIAPIAANASGPAACPFAALVGCARIYRKAIR